MRILTAATRLDGIGGLERAQLEACRQLSDRGHRIDLLYTDGGNLEPSWDAIVDRKLRVGGYAFSRRGALRSGRHVLGVSAAVRRLLPDLVYVHHHRHTPGAVLGGRPIVCHMHLPPPERRSRQEAVALRRVRGFVAVSRFTAGQWSERLRVSPDRFAIVPNGVDVDNFRPADDQRRASIRRELGLPSDRFLILYAGRVDPEKGVEYALDALRVLSPDEFHLAIAGEPNPGSFGGDHQAARTYGESLRGDSADLPVTWLGRLGDVSHLLAAADLVVLPSLFADPLPLIVLETLASGTPIVASAVGGIPEMLSDPLDRGLVAPGDAAALASRIRSLRAWRCDTPELGEEGRRLVSQRYSLPLMGERINRAIEAALSATPAETVTAAE
jgi:glycosyltransferase involved in cell wall biosynthesis